MVPTRMQFVAEKPGFQEMVDGYAAAGVAVTYIWHNIRDSKLVETTEGRGHIQQGGIDTVRTLMDREALGGFYPPFVDGNGRPVPGGRVGKNQLGNILPGK